MTTASETNKARNREIADNEEQRQVTGDLRVSAWAIMVAIVVAAVAVWTGWGWLHH